MSKTVAIGAMPVHLAEGKHEFEVQLRDPGHVRACAFTLQKRLVLTRGEAQFDEILTMFVEINENGPMRRRRFVVTATGAQLGVPDGQVLVFAGTAVSGNTGQVAHVFEVKAAP